MKNRLLYVVTTLLISSLFLTACNLPNRQTSATQTQPTVTNLQSSPTPTSLCDNLYFPNTVGDKWEYSGSNNIIGAYTRTDTITNSNAESFTMETNLASVTYSTIYDCALTGLTSRNPIQQYAGALLNNPDIPVSVTLTSNKGISLPLKIAPGDTWQQTADWEASSQQVNLNGRFVFDYTATGYENVTVPAGTYSALRIDATIQAEVTGLHIPAGTYTSTTWWVPKIGMVKSEGTSHVPGVEFSDSMELTSYTLDP